MFFPSYKPRSFFHARGQKGACTVRNMKRACSLFWPLLTNSISRWVWAAIFSFTYHFFLHQPTFLTSTEYAIWRMQTKIKTYHLTQRLLWKSSSCWEEAEWLNQHFLPLGPENAETKRREAQKMQWTIQRFSTLPGQSVIVCGRKEEWADGVT